MPGPDSRVPFIAMGATSIILQTVVLRLLLSTFSGNELDIGITLSLWFIFAGLGSYAGRKIRSRHAFMLSFLLISLLALPTIVAIKAIRPALSLEPGETVSLAYILMSTMATLLPVCFVVGLQFPLAVTYAGDEKSAGRVYGLEALGAFIGGTLFTFVFASRIQTFDLCLLLSVTNVLIAAYISRKKILAVLLLIPMLIYSAVHSVIPSLPWHHLAIVQTSESRYGEISVARIRDQVSVYANGHLLFSYPDSPAEEITVHIPMSLHPAPADILVIGGSPGTVKEFLKYPVKSVDFIELDPALISVSQGLLTAPEDRKALKDPRLKMIADDGRRFMKASRIRKYDLILINLPPPVSAGINRFYTTDFFREAKSRLNTNGVLFINLPASSGYIGRGMQTADGSLYNSLKAVFNHTGVTAQEYGGFFASDTLIGEEAQTLENRFAARKIPSRHFSAYIFRDAFDPPGVAYVKNRLDKIAALNTDHKPSAYLYNLMLWSEIHGGRWLSFLLKVRAVHAVLFLIIFLFSLALFILGRKERTIYYSIFTTGFSGMTLTMAAFLAYQATYGYIYEMIGLISAIFMIGLWLGTRFTTALGEASQHFGDPMSRLLCLELATIGLVVLSPLMFGGSPRVFLFVLASGAIMGSLFSSANAASADTGAAGKLYAMDLAGSFMGALIPSVIVIPLFGLYGALLLTAALKTFSAAMIRGIRT